MLFAATLPTLVRADDPPAPATLDLPVPTNRAMPVWIGQPQTPASVFATMNVPIMAPDSTSSLLLTVYFQEKQGGFLRIMWTGPSGSQMISENFYEGVGMANQRSLLIPADTLGGDGMLAFQTGDTTLGIQRLKLEWVESKPALAPATLTDTLVTSSSGQTQSAEDLNGQPPSAQAAAWQNQVVTVPLSDSAVRTEEGVEFSLDLDNVPTSARVALKEAGLPLGKHFAVWINQQLAGTITPAVPDLGDGGFFTASGTPSSYVGWRDGSFFIPVALLKPGVNTLQFDSEDDGDTATAPATSAAPNVAPIALKNLVVELSYQSAPQETPAPAPQYLLGPVTPLTPTPTDTTSTTSSP